MKLDGTTIVSYPSQSAWTEYYGKFCKALVTALGRHSLSFADVEDAVEEAFHKLMHKKDPAAYGDKMPQTEKEWFWALYWQARAYLSHLRSHAGVHARYVERTAQELESVFASGHQGEAMDVEVHSHALARALETLKAEQGISRRDLEIYLCRKLSGEPAKKVAEKYGIKPNNVDQIVWRVGLIVRKHGPRHVEAALRHEGYGFAA